MEEKNKIHRLVRCETYKSSKKDKIRQENIIKKSKQADNKKDIGKIQIKVIKYVCGCLSTRHSIRRNVYKQDGTRVHNNNWTVGRIPRWKKTSEIVLYLLILIVMSCNCIHVYITSKRNTVKYICAGFRIKIIVNCFKVYYFSINLKGMYGKNKRGYISGKKCQKSKKGTTIKAINTCIIISEKLVTDTLLIQSETLSVFRFNLAGEKSYEYLSLYCFSPIYIQYVHMGDRIGTLNKDGGK